MSHQIKILSTKPITHNVNRIRTEKPEGYSFKPGQATDVAINLEGYREEKRPFTFTSLPDDENLEFTIKSYHDHDGVTHKIDALDEGDEFIIEDAWGAIEYKGKGTFIAGGAGVTPFIAILRDLKAQNRLQGNQLLFSNKTAKDVIMEEELRDMLGEGFISTRTEQETKGHEHGRIDTDFLKKHVSDFSRHFYVCGPEEMVEDISKKLENLGANTDSIVFEE